MELMPYLRILKRWRSSYLENLLPWSKKLPEGIRKQQWPGTANYGGSQFFNVLAVERLLFFGILLANILSACGKAG